MPSIFEKYRLKQVINADGRMTALGVSTASAEVVEAMTYGIENYFEMKDLVDKTGEYIANLLNVEAATVVSCAAAGVAQSVAALIAKDDTRLMMNLHAMTPDGPNEIVLPKGHNVNFGGPIGTMIGLGGGKVVEAGWANECSAAQLHEAVGPKTAAILFVKSHHTVQKSMLSVAEAVEVARLCNVPLIVDAAAEEDLRRYYEMGADLVLYSGGKAIEGPTASGLVIGRKQYVEWVKLQAKGVGRAMKVSKEGILGLTTAIESYLTRPKETGAEMAARLQPFIDQLNKIEGVSARIAWDAAGRDISRGEISFDETKLGRTAVSIAAALKQGSVAIYFRGHRANEGKLEVDVRSVDNQQLTIISQSISRLLAGEKA